MWGEMGTQIWMVSGTRAITQMNKPVCAVGKLIRKTDEQNVTPV